MFATSRLNLFLILLVSTFICVSSTSLRNDDEEKHELVRERRQTLPDVIDTLKPLVISLLQTVANLLKDLGLRLPIILGVLLLGGLGLSLGIIVLQLSAVVRNLAGKKRRAAINLGSYPSFNNGNIVQKVNATNSAITKINNLRPTAQQLNKTSQLNPIVTKLQMLNATLSSAGATAQKVKNDLSQIVTSLTTILNQMKTSIIKIHNAVQSNTVVILTGLSLPLIYLGGLGSLLSSMLGGSEPTAVPLILVNVANAQNATVINTSNLNDQLLGLYATVDNVVQSIATGLKNAFGTSLTSCSAGR